MADYLTAQDVIDAKVDAHTLEVAVNGTAAQTVTARLGGRYHTLAYYFQQLEVIKDNAQLSANQKLDIINGLVATANTEITNLQSAIDIAAAAGAGANGWTDLLIATANGRTQRDKNNESISIKDFGAIGDGTLHTVQEWINSGKYANLAAIQVNYPHVTSLTDSIDWAATQKAVSTAPNVFCPRGKYVLNRVVKTLHNTSPRNIGSNARGVRIFGDGVQTVFTRNDENEATRIFNTENTSTTQESDTANSHEAIFAVHCPYTQITNMTLESSRIGLYFGQDFTQPFTSLSSVSRGRFAHLQISRCGTGILQLAVGGNHYCKFDNIHFTGCQIDVHKRASHWWKITQGNGSSNNNRNLFTNIRSGDSRVGLWNQCGDTDSIMVWHGENVSSTTTINPYAAPHHLPSGMLKTSAVFVFSDANQLNKMTMCQIENCEWGLYNDGYNNSFINIGVPEALTTFIQKPLRWSSSFSTRFKGYLYSDNSYPLLYPDAPVAGATYIGLESPNGVRAVAKEVWHQPATSTRGSYKKEFAIEAGEIQADTATAVTVWGNTDSSSCAMIEVDVVGRCDATSQIASFTTKAIVNVYRASTRSPSRYGIVKLHSSRATGENVLDTVEANHIALTVRRNPDVTQEIQVVLSCPFLLTSATIFAKLSVTK